MKIPNNLYSRLSLITCISLVTGYILVYAVGYITILPGEYASGQPLTSTLFGKVIDNIADLNLRLSNLTFSGGNVGIGTTSPTDPWGFGKALDIQTNGGAAAYWRASGTNPTTEYMVAGYSPTAGYIGTAGVKPLYFYTNSTEKMRIDSTGNVGIGTPSPGAKLHVVGGDIKLGLNAYGTSVAPSISGGAIERQLTIFGAVNSPALSLEYYSTGYGADLWVGTTGLGPVYFDQRQNDAIIFRTKTSATPAEAMRIVGNGNVMINTTTDAGYKLDVNGSVRGTSWTPSDRNLKKNIETLTGGLDKILSVRGVTYNWKDITKETGSQVGVIAQEVEEVFPELVNTDKQGMKAVNYAGLVAPLIEAVKELKKENDSLKSLVCLDHPTAEICK